MVRTPEGGDYTDGGENDGGGDGDDGNATMAMATVVATMMKKSLTNNHNDGKGWWQYLERVNVGVGSSNEPIAGDTDMGSGRGGGSNVNGSDVHGGTRLGVERNGKKEKWKKPVVEKKGKAGRRRRQKQKNGGKSQCAERKGRPEGSGEKKKEDVKKEGGR